MYLNDDVRSGFQLDGGATVVFNNHGPRRLHACIRCEVGRQAVNDQNLGATHAVKLKEKKTITTANLLRRPASMVRTIVEDFVNPRNSLVHGLAHSKRTHGYNECFVTTKLDEEVKGGAGSAGDVGAGGVGG
jgi:hypothetical protein